MVDDDEPVRSSRSCGFDFGHDAALHVPSDGAAGIQVNDNQRTAHQSKRIADFAVNGRDVRGRAEQPTRIGHIQAPVGKPEQRVNRRRIHIRPVGVGQADPRPAGLKHHEHVAGKPVVRRAPRQFAVLVRRRDSVGIAGLALRQTGFLGILVQ